MKTLVLLVLSAVASAQEMTLSLLDGSQVRGEIVRLRGDADLVLRDAAGERSWPLAGILAIHGRAPAVPDRGARALLVGGDQLTGELRGGDAGGESFVIASRSLGPVTVAVDRLRLIVFPERAGDAGLAELTVPADSAASEALFRPARRGFDTIVGAIFAFTARGVVFQWTQSAEPSTHDYETLAGIAVRGGEAPAQTAPAQLVSRSGDVLGVALQGLADGRLELLIDGEHMLRVPLAEVACLTLRGADRVFLADLQPERAVEFAHDVGDEPPLHPWRRDRAAPGGFLQLGGLGYGKGLGVAGLARLEFKVPDGVRRLLARAGIDDAAAASDVRGQVRARIRVGDKDLWGPVDVRGGEPAHAIDVPVTPGAIVALEVELGEGWFLGDWLDWANAVFVR
jgi:hypothetical protein